MLPPYRTLSLRYFRLRWDRTALIVASIALGVATLVSTRMLNQCIDAAARQKSGLAVASDVQFLIQTGEAGVRKELLEPVRAVPGVRKARPWLFQRVQLTDLDHRVATLIGFEISPELLGENPYGVRITNTLEGFTIRGLPSLGTFFRRPVFISRNLYEERKNLGTADAVLKARAGGQEMQLVPVGVIDLEGLAADLGRNVIAMQIDQAASAVGRPGLLSRIDVTLEPGADPEAVRVALEEVVGDKAQVRLPETQGQETQEVISGVKIGFALCGAGALVVGLFLVYNAMAVSVAERRHDIGVMRSLGATRTQVTLLFAGEAVLMGLLGSMLGIPIGVGLAELALKEIDPELARLFAAEGSGSAAKLSPVTLLIAGLAGTLTALGAALIPAVQAANDQPADAIRRVPSAQAGYFRVLQGSVCIALVAGGYASYLLRDDLPHKIGIYACPVLMLLGMLMGLPLVVGLVARLFQPLARLLFGVEARLAADNLVRAPGRTGVVIGALAAGVALMYLIAGVGRSNEEPVLDWVDRFATADLYVFYGDPASASASAIPMDEKVGAEMRRLPGVKQVVPIRYCRPIYGGSEVYLVALDAVAFHDHSGGESKLAGVNLFPRLREPGTVIVSDNFAVNNKVKAGDTIRIQGPNGPASLRVLGTVQDYSWAKGTLFMDRERYAELFSDPLVDAYHVHLRGDADPEAATAGVRKFADRQALTLIDRDVLKNYVRDVIDRVYRLAYLQQVVVGIVAALGVVMALLISILQRRRELGTLRAVGATQGQVLKSVMAEAMLMGAVGTVLGILVGLPLEWYILRVVIFEESGFLFPVIIPWLPALGIGAIAVALAALAGLGPALHAVRINIAEAIAYE